MKDITLPDIKIKEILFRWNELSKIVKLNFTKI